MNKHMSHWSVAEEVIREACKRFNHDDRDLPEIRDAVINERWPACGNGGVAMAQRRTREAVYWCIREYYRPDDHSPEPTGMRN